jgi:hypothetical protein
MQHLRRLNLALWLMWSLSACEIHPFSNTEAPTLSNLQVGPGVTPTFSWTGSEATYLAVRRVSDGEIIWLIRDSRGMPSPITYGIPPSDAEEPVRLQSTLTEGVAYQVQVTASGFFEEGATVYQTFTP